jgi:hypothetical protein
MDIWDFLMTIQYFLCSFGTFFTVLVTCAKKTLAAPLLTKRADANFRNDNLFANTLFLPTNFSFRPMRIVLQGLKCLKLSHRDQGCQMVHFQTKNPNLGKFWRALEWEMLLYFMAIRNI